MDLSTSGSSYSHHIAKLLEIFPVILWKIKALPGDLLQQEGSISYYRMLDQWKINDMYKQFEGY